MIISSDNQIVDKNIPTYKCPVKDDGTVVLKPSQAQKYLGSYLKYKILNYGILISSGTMLDIISEDDVNGTDFLLISYNGKYMYTPKEYVNTNSITTYSSLPIKDSNSTKIESIKSLSTHTKKSTPISTYERRTPNSVTRKGTTSTTSQTSSSEEYYCKQKLNTDRKYIIGECKLDNFILYSYPSFNSNIDGYLKKGDRFIIQSIWHNNKLGCDFFYTDSDPCGYGIFSSSTVKEINANNRDDRSGNNYYYSIIFEACNTYYMNGTIHAGLNRGDRTWPAYQQWGQGYHICADDSSGGSIVTYYYPAVNAAPLADSKDMFEENDLGLLTVTKNATVYSMHRRSNTKSKNTDLYLGYISLYDLNNRYNQNKTVRNIIKDGFEGSNHVEPGAIDNAELFSTTETMKVVKKTTIGRDDECDIYIGFRDTSAADGAENYIVIKNDPKYCKYIPLPPQYIDLSTNLPVTEYKGVDDVSNYDVTNDTVNKGKDNILQPTRTLDPDIEDNSERDPMDKVYNTKINLDPSNMGFHVPGIDENAPTIPPDYEGWPILDNVSDYNLTNEMPYDTRHLNLINRFHLPTNLGGLTTKSFIFMTRPDLNLYKDLDDLGVIDPWTMNPDLKRLPGYIYMARLQGTKESPGIGRNIMNSLEYYGTLPQGEMNTPWLSVITNQASGYTIADRELDTVEMGETFHGNKVIYAEPTFKHKIAGTTSIQFNERRDLTLYFTLRFWIEYIQAVSMGYTSPRKVHIRNNELDYGVSLFYITTDETMENILYWEKLTGVIPLTVPDSFFEWADGVNNAKDMKYTINFAYSFRSVLDEFHLCEINNLYKNAKYRTPAKSFPIVPPENYYAQESSSRNDNILGRLAAFYGTITDDDKNIKALIDDKETLKKYYYGGLVNKDNLTYIDNASKVSDGKSVAYANFLPNYDIHTQTYGIPYVTGPFIEFDSDAKKYILRWV